jgi:acyl-CoA thioesterase YciA
MGENLEANQRPEGFLAIRARAMPADTNPAGHIFGGWLMSQMDLAGAIHAGIRAKGTVATVAVDGMVFHAPVHVGDELSCYTHLVRSGRTSLSIRIEAWVRRSACRTHVKVTSAVYHFVAVDDHFQPRPLPPEDDQTQVDLQ